MCAQTPSRTFLYVIFRICHRLLGVANCGARKPFLRDVPPFLLALLCQQHNCLEVPWASNIVLTHVLLGSRQAVFVERNILVAKDACDVSPFFSVAPCGGGEQLRRQLSSSCINRGLIHLADVSPAFLLCIFLFFIPSTFAVGCLRLFLVYYTTIPCVGQ